MTFAEIIPHLVAGEKVTWGGHARYIHIVDDKVVYSTGGDFVLNKFILISNNWEVIEEAFDFAEALNIMKKGGGVRRKAWSKGDWLSSKNTVASIAPEDVTATDWVIFKD